MSAKFLAATHYLQAMVLFWLWVLRPDLLPEDFRSLLWVIIFYLAALLFSLPSVSKSKEKGGDTDDS